MRLLIALVVLLLPAAALAEPIDLVCQGQARMNEATQTHGSVTATDGQSAYGSTTSLRKVRSDEIVRVKLDGAGAGSLKLPPALIPTISRGKDGWWSFTELVMNDSEIRGRFSLNAFNKPRLLIDRRTGDIDLKGLGFTFTGSCERQAEAPDTRKF